MTIKRFTILAAAIALAAGFLTTGSGAAVAVSQEQRPPYRLDADAGRWGATAPEYRGRAFRSTAARQGAKAVPSQGGVFKTSFTLAQFEQLAGVSMSRTFGSRTWFSHFRGRPTLAEDGYNFYVNRNNGRIVFRSLGNAQAPFNFASTFVEVGSRSQTNLAFNWSSPRALAITGFQNPVAVSSN